MSNIRVLMIGDLVGPAGIKMFEKHIGSLKEKYKADAIIVNGENSADNGRGITPAIADHFFEMGVNVITTGNHIGHKRRYFPISFRSLICYVQQTILVSVLVQVRLLLI